jgi:hypothetical protein
MIFDHSQKTRPQINEFWQSDSEPLIHIAGLMARQSEGDNAWPSLARNCHECGEVEVETQNHSLLGLCNVDNLRIRCG